MALNSFVCRASSSITPLTVRLTQGGQFLPFVGFSTLTNKNFGSIIESGAAPNDESQSIRGESPFNVVDYGVPRSTPTPVRLKSEYKNETIEVEARRTDLWDGEPRIIPMDVLVKRGKEHLYFKVSARQHGQINIHSLKARASDDQTFHLDKFEGLVRSKGINSGLINLFSHHLGIKPKNP